MSLGADEHIDYQSGPFEEVLAPSTGTVMSELLPVITPTMLVTKNSIESSSTSTHDMQ